MILALVSALYEAAIVKARRSGGLDPRTSQLVSLTDSRRKGGS